MPSTMQRSFNLHLAAGPDRPVPLQGPAQEHQHQQNGLLRHGAGVAALVVADIDAPPPGGVQIDAVKGHPLRMDHPQPRQPLHQRRSHRGDGVHEQDPASGAAAMTDASAVSLSRNTGSQRSSTSAAGRYRS